jgi:hypothetical protein
MKVITFKPQFAPLVHAGVKRQTIRPPQKRPLVVGQSVSLREWSGKPYRSPQRVLRDEVRITEVTPITITETYVMFTPVDGRAAFAIWWNDDKINEFARADGFASWVEMREWFDAQHGLPFVGVLIKWLVFFDRNSEVRFHPILGGKHDGNLYTVKNVYRDENEPGGGTATIATCNGILLSARLDALSYPAPGLIDPLHP